MCILTISAIQQIEIPETPRNVYSSKIPETCPYWGPCFVIPTLFGSRLAVWLDHYRRLQLQDGAFMAMLLDSYVVEPGQPWWLYLGLFHCFGRFFFSFFVVPMAAWCFFGG